MVLLCVLSLNVSATLLIQTFDIENIYLHILFFKARKKLSATTDYHSLCVEYISMIFL